MPFEYETPEEAAHEEAAGTRVIGGVMLGFALLIASLFLYGACHPKEAKAETKPAHDSTIVLKSMPQPKPFTITIESAKNGFVTLTIDYNGISTTAGAMVGQTLTYGKYLIDPADVKVDTTREKK